MSRKYLSPYLLGALLVIVLAIALSSPAAARGPVHMRAFALWIQPNLDFNMTGEEQDLTADADGALGLGISGEYQFSDRLGLELGIFRASPDVNLVNTIKELDLTARASDGQAMTPATLGLNIHLLPEDRLDLYISPFLAYVYYGDLDFFISETIDAISKFTPSSAY